MSGQDPTTARITEIQVQYADELMSKANVVGLGVGLRQRGGITTEETCLVVMVSHKVPSEQLAPDDRIPKQIEGVPVDVRETGMFTAQ